MEKDYLLTLHENPPPWALRFVKNCVEHILPVVERDAPGDVHRIRTALNSSDIEALDTLLFAVAGALASKREKLVYYGEPSLAKIVATCLALADSSEEERQYQQRQFSDYEESTP